MKEKTGKKTRIIGPYILTINLMVYSSRFPIQAIPWVNKLKINKFHSLNEMTGENSLLETTEAFHLIGRKFRIFIFFRQRKEGNLIEGKSRLIQVAEGREKREGGKLSARPWSWGASRAAIANRFREP